MLTTPQKRAGASTMFGTPTTRMPLTKGLFSDGIWHCNCSPRLPATNFQVKKEGRNKGRWFYTCQTNKDDGGCGFFLWDEEAKNREGMVVIGNSRSEKSPQSGESYTPSKNRTPVTAVRGDVVVVNLASDESDDDSEFGSWPSSSSTMVDPVNGPETPRKASRVGVLTTPGSKRKRDHDFNEGTKTGFGIPPTPITGGGVTSRRVISMSEYGDDDDIFSTPSSLKTPSNDNSFGIRSPSHTPTPFANHSRQESPSPRRKEATTTVPSNPYDVTYDVFTLLEEQDVLLDEETRGRLKGLLGRHAMRVSGIAKGRDITRVALKSKDVQIAELTLKVGQLEGEREVDRRILRSLRSERERDRGR